MREEGRYMLVIAIICPLDTVTSWLAFRWWPTGASWIKRDSPSLYTKRFSLGQCFFHWDRLDCVATDRFWQSMLSFFATVPTIPYCLHLACFILLLSSWHPYHIIWVVIPFYSGIFLAIWDVHKKNREEINDSKSDSSLMQRKVLVIFLRNTELARFIIFRYRTLHSNTLS